MAKQKEAWDKLSMQEKALLIKLSVDNGVSSLKLIRDTFNMYAEGGSKETRPIKDTSTKEYIVKKWPALGNIDFEVWKDPTFTREKTGAGSIEYFNAKYPGVTYLNGQYVANPSPGKDVIMYDPNTNDEQDVRLDALHIMPKDATYDALNALYRQAALNSDVSYNAKKNYERDKKLYGESNTDSYELYFNNEADGLLRNMFIEGTPLYIESKRYYPNIQQLREWNTHLLPYIDEIHKYMETGLRPSYILPEITVTPNGVLYKNGGNLVHKKSGEELGESQELHRIPEVSIIEEPWADAWFKDNKNVAGMAIGKGLNGVDGERRVIINPYNTQMNDATSRASVLLNERLRHVMDQENFSLPNITKELLQKYDGTSYLGDTLNIGRTEVARYLSGDPSHNLTNSLKLYVDSLKSNYKKSTGGPLYPFSFEKNPFLKTPVVRYDEGGKKYDASNPGGYTNTLLAKNSSILRWYDPTGGLDFINYVLSLNFGNMARGEENEYWKEYLGLPSAVPLMNSNANTEWDKKIEQEKIAKGELASDFYGTTPRMDYNILALADTLMLGNMVRNYEEYDKKYNLPHIETVTEAYEQAKNILNNPNKWTQVDGEIEVNNWPFNPNISESNPLGMLANFGMKWVPEENALYMHDTYDFPSRVHKRTEIPVRPREMKIRSKISFDPTKGSWLLRSPVNYNTEIPAKVTK